MTARADSTGTLYVVATPIGNLEDLSPRAVRILSSVALIAAEDTRHSKKLLTHFGVGTRLMALHDHNERSMAGRLIRQLEQGEDVALISDAGTPLISDPGYPLVSAAHDAGIRVLPIPGPAALTAALSVAGLPTDRFFFEGFLPARQTARRQRLHDLRAQPFTLVFYEASHRIADALADMAECLGAERRATIARELTKTFETVRHDTLSGLRTWLEHDPHRQKGEFVVMVHGAVTDSSRLDEQACHTLAVLLEELPLKQAVSLAARITGLSRNALYDYGLTLKQAADN